MSRHTLIAVLVLASAALSACARAPEAAAPAALQAAPPTEAQAQAVMAPPSGAVAPMAFEVSQVSPLLSPAQKGAISQAFYGAPMDVPYAVHTLTAQAVSCRAQTPSVGTETTCSVVFEGHPEVTMTGEAAAALFDGLGRAGVEGEGGMSHVERAITDLACTIDDKVAFETPMADGSIAGYTCTFRVAE